MLLIIINAHLKTADLPMNFRDAAIRTVFYDLTFFIIVTTIGLNIVFGIIVDTFSELRDERVICTAIVNITVINFIYPVAHRRG